MRKVLNDHSAKELVDFDAVSLRSSGFRITIDGRHDDGFYASSCVYACCSKVNVFVLDAMFVVMEEAASATSIDGCNN
jgi:hypothetical protein